MLALFATLEPTIVTGNETRKIDLKRELDLNARPKAAKFAKLVSALANTPGGAAYIVVGVKDAKDRSPGNDPEDYIVGVQREEADEFQRQIQQALVNYLDRVPVVEYVVFDHPVVRKSIGVIHIARSFNRPHRVQRESGEVEQGVYLKRGSEIMVATADEVKAMEEASEDGRLILNFHHPFSHAQLLEARSLLGALPEVINMPGIPVQFSEQPLSEQVGRIVDGAWLTLEEWSSLRLIVNLPGLSPAASAVLAEIHGRSGNFPHILRMTRPFGEDLYKVVEIVKLQDI